MLRNSEYPVGDLIVWMLPRVAFDLFPDLPIKIGAPKLHVRIRLDAWLNTKFSADLAGMTFSLITKDYVQKNWSSFTDEGTFSRIMVLSVYTNTTVNTIWSYMKMWEFFACVYYVCAYVCESRTPTDDRSEIERERERKSETNQKWSSIDPLFSVTTWPPKMTMFLVKSVDSICSSLSVVGRHLPLPWTLTG